MVSHTYTYAHHASSRTLDPVYYTKDAFCVYISI